MASEQPSISLLPPEVINYLLWNNLDVVDISKCIRTAHLFNVLAEQQSIVYQTALKGFKYCLMIDNIRAIEIQPIKHIYDCFEKWFERKSLRRIILKLCQKGCCHSLEYIHRHYVITIYHNMIDDETTTNYISPYVNINYMFLVCFKFGQLETAKWLINYNKNKLMSLTTKEKRKFKQYSKKHNDDIESLLEELDDNQLSLLDDEEYIDLNDFHIKLKLRCSNYVAFYLACKYDYLDIAKWFYELVDEYCLAHFYNILFDTCCDNKRIKMAKWLHKLNTNTPKSDSVDINYKEGFRTSCKNNDIVLQIGYTT